MQAPGGSELDGPARAAEKSPDAFRTISEVSVALDVPQHVLRFWEGKFAQIRPLKRGGGRRYYRPDDVDLLRGIQALLYGEGYTIRGVQKLLRENGVKFVVAAGRKRAEMGLKGRTPNPPTPRGAAAPVTAAGPQLSPEAAPEFTDAPLAADEHDPEIWESFSGDTAAPEADEITLDADAREGEASDAAAEPAVEASEATDPDEDDEVTVEFVATEPAETLAAADEAPVAPADRRAAAARLLSKLKAMRRDYDLKLQAAKNGRAPR